MSHRVAETQRYGDAGKRVNMLGISQFSLTRFALTLIDLLVLLLCVSVPLWQSCFLGLVEK